MSSSIAESKLNPEALPSMTRSSLASRNQIPPSPVGAENHGEFNHVFTAIEKGKLYLKDGAKRIMSAPFANALTFAMSMDNEKHSSHEISSDASCTTNCLTFLAKIIYNSFSIAEGIVTTAHVICHGGQPLLVVMELHRAWSLHPHDCFKGSSQSQIGNLVQVPLHHSH